MKKSIARKPLSILLSLLMLLSVCSGMAFPAQARGGDPNCLTFTGETAFTLTGTNLIYNGTLEYSTDATSWTTWDKSEISSTDTAPYVLYLRGNGNTGVYTNFKEGLQLSEPAACSGNIMTLLNYENPGVKLTNVSLTIGAFQCLFYKSINLTSAPELPATTLGNRCYQNMFDGCERLTEAPELPAKTMTNSCYNCMFKNCTSLTELPELPATKLDSSSYGSMFDGCTGIRISDEAGTFNNVNYSVEYRIPSEGTITASQNNSLTYMFSGTGGKFTGTPTINTTYYVPAPTGVIDVIKDCTYVREKGSSDGFAVYANVPLTDTSHLMEMLTGSIAVQGSVSAASIRFYDTKGYTYQFYDAAGTVIPANSTQSISGPGSQIGLSGNATVYQNAWALTLSGSCDAVFVVATAPVLGPYTVEINGAETGYETFAEALAAWTEGSTLKLNAEAEVSAPIEVDESKTLDLNGHGIIYTGSQYEVICLGKKNSQTVSGKTLTLIDSAPNAGHKYSVNENGLAIVDDENGTTSFTGGYITGGKGSRNAGNGGAVYIEGANSGSGDNVLVMRGGNLVGNSALQIGGAVFANANGAFSMEGGSIFGNVGQGGALGVWGGTLTVSDGSSIHDNKSPSGGGGAIYLMNGTLNLNGGEIKNNQTSSANGGAIYYAYGTLNISGNPVFEGNTGPDGALDIRNASSGNIINITGPLNENVRISVKWCAEQWNADTQSYEPEYYTGTFTSGLADNGVADNFVSVVDSYTVVTDENGEAQFVAAATTRVIDLGTLTADFEAQDGDVLTGTLAGDYQITAAAGATITLRDADITCLTSNAEYAGINPLGDLTILLEGANAVRGGHRRMPGIYVPENTTLTIDGTGSLEVSSGGSFTDSSNAAAAPGIGAKRNAGNPGYAIPGGSIVINGGTIIANGGNGAAGIGGCAGASTANIFVDITINGGTVTATGRDKAPGIGSGNNTKCGNITITGGTVTATGLDNAPGIGAGTNESGGTCGNISITGGTVTATGNGYGAGIGGGNRAKCGDITIADTVTLVTAIKGEDERMPNTVGVYTGATCGTITVGGAVVDPITVSPFYYPSYTVTWKNDDDSVIDTTSVPNGAVPTHDDPTKEASTYYTYTFNGWTDGENSYGLTDTLPPVTGDATYTATFTPQAMTFMIKVKKLTGATINVYDVTGETTVAQVKEMVADEAGIPASEQRLIFAGKTLADDKTLSEYNVQKESTLHVVGAPATYTVTWKNGNNPIETDEGVAYGTTPSYDGETPTKAADAQYTYDFSGWTDGENSYGLTDALPAVTGDVTYTATFSNTTNTYTVTWKNGNNPIETDEGVAYGTTPSYDGETPTKAATAQYTYAFSGWTDGENTYGLTDTLPTVTADVTYTATFSETTNTYTIMWKNGDAVLKTIDGIPYGDPVLYDERTPVKAPDEQNVYTFSGWSDGENFYEADETLPNVSGNVTYYAQFTTSPRSETGTIEINLHAGNATIDWDDNLYSIYNVWFLEAAGNDYCVYLENRPTSPFATTYAWDNFEPNNCHIDPTDGDSVYFTDGSCTVTVDGDVKTLSGTFYGYDGNTYVVTITTADLDQEAAAALAQAKADAKTELAAYKNAADYRPAQQTELADAITAGNNAIDAAADLDAVATALANAKAAIDAIKTDAELTAEEAAAALAAAKEQLTGAVNTAKAFYDTIKDIEKYATIADTLDTAIQQGEAMLNSDDANEILAKAEQVLGVLASVKEQKDAIDATPTDDPTPEDPTPDEPTPDNPTDKPTDEPAASKGLNRFILALFRFLTDLFNNFTHWIQR